MTPTDGIQNGRNGDQLRTAVEIGRTVTRDEVRRHGPKLGTPREEN